MEVLTSGLVAAALAALVLVETSGASEAATWRLAGGAVVTLVVIVVALHLLVFGPMRNLVKRSRERLGSDFTRSDPRHRNETRELSYLVDLLIAVFTASEDKEWVSQSVRDELEHALAINRQLMDVGELGREMNAALPYRETVARVLSCTKAFLRADVVALLLLDEEGDTFVLEGAQGTLSPDSSTECCATTPDCPVRQAVTGGSLVRVEGHTCSLFPHTMAYQVVIPVLTENIGDMGLLATATSGDYIRLLPDDILAALQNHVQSAVANAFKYDAVRRQVVTDHLTHLYNRRFFMNRAREEIERTLRHKDPLSV
ncbi:MAG TPA: hypothetical protein VFH61_00915, partial [Thermoleophilia bacterium]|nr:hypothetical protein [Thermoleophilia bacterium]